MARLHITQGAEAIKWVRRRLFVGLTFALAFGLIVSLLPGVFTTPAEAVVTENEAASSNTANSTTESTEYCNAPWGDRIPALEDLEVRRDQEEGYNFPGRLADTTYGDFNGDEIEEPVHAAWKPNNDSLILYAPKKGGGFKMYSDIYSSLIRGVVVSGDIVRQEGETYPKDEVVYVSMYKTGLNGEGAANIRVRVLDENLKTLNPEVSLDLPNSELVKADSTLRADIGDFDGDGDDEIVVVTSTSKDISIHLFNLVGQLWVGRTALKITEGLSSASPVWHEDLPSEWVSLAVGDVDRDFKDEIVIAYEEGYWTKTDRGDPSQQKSWIFARAYSVTNGGLQLRVNERVDDYTSQPDEHVGQVPTDPDGQIAAKAKLEVADINGDSVREIVALWGQPFEGSRPETTKLEAYTLADNPKRTGFKSLLDYDNANIFPLKISKVTSLHLDESVLDLYPAAGLVELQAGDINADGKEELAFSRTDGVKLYTYTAQEKENANRDDFFDFELQRTPEGETYTTREGASLNLADTDGDTLYATLGAGSFDLPSCADSTNPNFSLELPKPPSWRNTEYEEPGYSQFGSTSTEGASEGKSVTDTHSETTSWSTTVSGEKNIGGVGLTMTATYKGSKTEANSEGRGDTTSSTESVTYGLYSTKNNVVAHQVPTRCYNYTAYLGLAPLYPDVKVDEVMPESKAIKLDGAEFGQKAGLFRQCKPKDPRPFNAPPKTVPDGKSAVQLLSTSTSVGMTSDTWEEYNSLYSGEGNVSDQFAVVRPDWSSFSLFMGDRTSQSSGKSSANAVDGLLSRVSPRAPAAQTANELHPWWQIDLGESRPISSLRVLAADRNLRNVVVFLSNEDLSKLPESKDPEALSEREGVLTYAWPRQVNEDLSIATYKDGEPASARYVRVQRTDDIAVRLALTEVQLFEDSYINPSDFPLQVKGDPLSKFEKDPSKTLPELLSGDDPNKSYKVVKYNKYEDDYVEIDQRGTLLVDFADPKYEYPQPIIAAGHNRLNMVWKAGVSKTHTNSWTAEESTMHGFSSGASIQAGLKIPVIGETKVTVSAESGKTWTNGIIKGTTEGTTFSKDVVFETATGGFLLHPEGYVSKNAVYPAICSYTFTPSISHRNQIANEGFRHTYPAMDFVVPEMEGKSLRREDGKSNVCGLGGYRFNSVNSAPNLISEDGARGSEADDERTHIVVTRPGEEIDLDLLERWEDEDKYQKLAIHSVNTKDTDGDVDLINTGRLNPVDKTVKSLIRYTPPANATEQSSDSFVYTVTDGETTSTEKIKILIEEPLVAVDDTIPQSNPATVGMAAEVDVLSNDKGPDRDFRVVSVTDGKHTKVTLDESTGVVTAIPLKHDEVDSFTYTVMAGEQKQVGKVSIYAVPRTGWSAFERLEAETGALSGCDLYVDQSQCPKVVVDSKSSNGAHTVSLRTDGTYIDFNDVDFGESEGELSLTASRASGGGSSPIQMRLDGSFETIGNWTLSGDDLTTSFKMSENITGTHDVRIRIPETLGAPGLALDYIQFSRLNPEVDPPEANDDEASARVGDMTYIDVLENDSDPQGRNLEILSVSGGDKLDVVERSGMIFFTPLSAGVSSFTYTVTNGPKSDSATVKVDIEADGPRNAFKRIEAEHGELACAGFYRPARCPEIVLDKDSSNSAHVEWPLGTYVDSADDAIKFAEVDFGKTDGELRVAGARAAGSASGTLNIKVDGASIGYWDLKNKDEFSFELEKNITGVHEVQVELSDLDRDEVFGLDYIQFERDEDLPPVAVDDVSKYKLAYNKTVEVDVLSNDYDPGMKKIKVVKVYQGQHTTVELVDGKVMVTPRSVLGWEDVFRYDISNGSKTAYATFRFNQRGALDPIPDQDPAPEPEPDADPDPDAAPLIAVNDRIEKKLKAGVPVRVDVLTNDEGPEDTDFKVVKVFKGMHTDVELKNGEVWVTPQNGEEDFFGYEISDGSQTSEATVQLNGSYAAGTAPAANSKVTPKTAPTQYAFDKLEGEDAVMICKETVDPCGEKHGGYMSKIMVEGTTLMFGNVEFGDTEAPLTLKGWRNVSSRWGELTVYVDGKKVPLKVDGKTVDTWKLRSSRGDKVSLGETFTGQHTLRFVLAKDAAALPGLELNYLQFAREKSTS